MNPYLLRARRALRTARLSLRDGDSDSAASRLYYAVFDAARAVLSARRLADLDRIKTHHGLDVVFTAQVVKPGLIEASVARMLRRGYELRADADYGDGVDLNPAAIEALIDQGAQFIDACAALVEESSP